MKVGTIDSYVVGALKIISPNLAQYYLMHDTSRKFLNFGLLYFVTYWSTVPMTVALALGLGASPLAWVLSGFFVGVLVASIRFLFSHYWIWSQGKEQGGSRGEQTAFTSTTATESQQNPSVTPASPNGKVADCSTCSGVGIVNDQLCIRCRGHGKIRIVPRGNIPTMGGKGSGNFKLPDIMWMLIFIIVGILIAGIGSRVPLVGNWIALGGVGIMLVGIFMFKPKKKTVVNPNVSA